jgi:hypothetical protein
MNEFYKIIEFLKLTIDSNPLVNTITHGTPDLIDIDKKNIYPLVHLNVTQSQVLNGYVSFDIEITSLDIRNVVKSNVRDKFLGNDNELDNLNTCHAILNHLITKLKLQYNDFDVELLNEPNLIPMLLQFSNQLDGWQTTLTLGIKNEVIVCD